MTPEDKIGICKICLNKDFNPKSGIVCRLTNEKPSFEEECPNFKLNAEEIAKKKNEARIDTEDLNSGLKVLSFCIPLAGAIIWLVKMGKQPTQSKQACALAWWGILFGVVVRIISVLITDGL